MKKQKYQKGKQYGNFIVIQDYFCKNEWIYNVKYVFPARFETINENLLTNKIKHDDENNISFNNHLLELASIFNK